MNIRIYVEGGGDQRQLKANCREGFRDFFKKAGFQERMPKIIACGGRDDAYDMFKTAHANRNEYALLLVDAEGPITEGQGPWQHLEGSEPDNASEEQCHLMVQVMESWFLADRAALAEYYGQGFRSNVIPQYQDVEIVRKEDVYSKLRQATASTNKGRYNKAADSFKILGRINPEKVRQKSAHADRLIRHLDQQTRGRK